MSVDLSFDDGRPLWAVGDMNSAAAALIEESLPTPVDDAWRVLNVRRPRR